MASPSASGDETPGRWQIIRDVAVFQVKLFADGFRDLVFSPLAFFLALVDLITGGQRFYNLLSLGRRTDVWINLFGNYGGAGIDEAVGQVEALIAEQYRKGGITASAKQAVDAALDRLTQEQPPEPE